MFNRTIKISILTILGLISVISVILIFQRLDQSKSKQERIENSDFPSLSFFSQSNEKTEAKEARNKEEIKKAFQDFLEETEQNKKNFLEIKLVDTSGNNFTLDDSIESLGFSIKPEVKKIVRQNDYSFFSCYFPEKGKDYGIILNIGRFRPEEKFDYRTLPDKLDSEIENWKTVLRDLHDVLFPEINFSEEQLNQKIDFKQGRYLYSEIILPDGSKKSINYVNIGDPIIITTSLECIETAINEIADYTEENE